MGKGKSTTDEPTTYSEVDLDAIYDELDDAWGDYDEEYDLGDPSDVLGDDIPGGYDEDDDNGPTRMFVEAEIEWAGTFNPKAYRSTTFDHLRLGGVKRALDNVRRAESRAAAAPEGRSYRAVGWHAQIRALLDAGQRGSAAADRAGLAPSTRSVRAWLSEERAPSKANQEKIAEAYRAMASRHVDSARERVAEARRELGDAMSAALRDRYGVEIRLFNIGRLELEP